MFSALFIAFDWHIRYLKAVQVPLAVELRSSGSEYCSLDVVVVAAVKQEIVAFAQRLVDLLLTLASLFLQLRLLVARQASVLSADQAQY